MLFIWCYLIILGLWLLEEDHGSKTSSPSYSSKGTYCQCGLSLLMFILLVWLSFCHYLSSSCKNHYLPLSTLFSLDGSPMRSPHLRNGKLCSTCLRAEIYWNYLELLCMGNLSIVSHLLIYSLIIYLYQYGLWTHGYLFYHLDHNSYYVFTTIVSTLAFGSSCSWFSFFFYSRNFLQKLYHDLVYCCSFLILCNI